MMVLLTGHFMFVSYYALFTLVPPFAVDRGGEEWEIGIVIGSIGIMALLVRPFGGRWINSFGAKRIAISGAGKVGGKLAKLLHKEGVKLSIANIDQSQLNDLSNDVKFSRVSPDEIVGLKCDLLSPCALGKVIHKKNINSLNCKMIVGGANNQLGNESIGLNLKNNNVVYSPDFLVNSGGVIAISCEINKNEKNLEYQLNTIGKRTTEILEISQKINKATNTVAKNLAWERINNSG